MKSILITGSSSGFGLETAKFFLERGWRVIATMRTPNAELFPRSENLRILPLDVTNLESIRKAITEAGPVDVLVNNAGVGMMNALEGLTMDEVRGIFETNTFGTMAMIQAVLPQMRERRSGLIINVTSSVTYKAVPFLSVYTATKAAVNAFTEALALELAPFNIRTKLVLPGRAPGTDFAKTAMSGGLKFPDAYSPMAEKIFAGFSTSTEPVTVAADVAETIWNVVMDDTLPMKIPSGKDAILWSKGS